MYEQVPAALTIKAAAEALSISRAQAYRLSNSGELQTVLVGRRRRVPRRVIEEMLAPDRALVPQPIR